MRIDLSAQIDEMVRLGGCAAGRYAPASELRPSITTPKRITLPDAELMLWRELFTGSESAGYFRCLLDGADWRQDGITLFGRTLNSPRLTAWYGEAGVTYAYSGLSLVAKGWLPTLLGIRERVGQAAGTSFNSVLLNLYRNEADSMGWHSDDEPSLGPNPVIGSVSFGATRTFQLRHKRCKTSRSVIELTDGSLLLMSGSTQHHWRHRVPKSNVPCSPRINLTFRTIK
ncbi:MAG: alpha-ketoglutarate-dependent dioxygenase AlkB family protein [Gammaproteobacteria bacterium]